ncbi:putative PAS/PAC sensor protein [Anaerovibrio sp. JC8]|uniref:response regulator n=1 Tax=Anaerovibrio sp. JC8 TaxID=1240085 RepID=UPI000A0E0FFA|nr:response regulator [Anaerovibrio sp. JC8]ORU00632.1 putative PAS/PAC sensor protein [Anaerovibrio sp. JC8]
MQKKVVLIHKGKSFMLGTIAKNLADGGYVVIDAEPTVEDIGAHKGETDLFILYLGEYVDDVASTLVYIKDICTEEDKLLIVIGTATELEVANRSIPAALISATFERPFDMKKLVAQADWLLEANDDLAKRKSILLVDDDGTFLKMVKDWLSSKYRVTIVTSGAQALMYIAENRPDLILLDYEMPVTSGPQLLEMIRSETKVDSIPVIFLTGKGDPESVKKVLAMKPDGYLLKSQDRAKLIAAVDDFFEKQKFKKLHDDKVL